jgi:hypothetical protein
MNQFPPSHLNFFENLWRIFAAQGAPPVSLILVVHLHLRISPRIFLFEITLIIFSGAWGKMIHKKNLKKKILWHCPLNAENSRDVPVSVEVVLVAGLAGGVHRGVPIRAGARVRAGQRGVHFRHLQTGANLEKWSVFMLIKKFKEKKEDKNNIVDHKTLLECQISLLLFVLKKGFLRFFYTLQPQKIVLFWRNPLDCSFLTLFRQPEPKICFAQSFLLRCGNKTGLSKTIIDNTISAVPTLTLLNKNIVVIIRKNTLYAKFAQIGKIFWKSLPLVFHIWIVRRSIHCKKKVSDFPVPSPPGCP